MLQENSELTELFDLEPSEELLERFACALLQTYSCSHNEFTPEQKVSHYLLSTFAGSEAISLFSLTYMPSHVLSCTCAGAEQAGIHFCYPIGGRGEEEQREGRAGTALDQCMSICRHMTWP